jgi:hypothetical protein
VKGGQNNGLEGNLLRVSVKDKLNRPSHATLIHCSAVRETKTVSNQPMSATSAINVFAAGGNVAIAPTFQTDVTIRQTHFCFVSDAIII